jgi:uncharacterized protein YndB with AHSA1/START domain
VNSTDLPGPASLRRCIEGARREQHFHTACDFLDRAQSRRVPSASVRRLADTRGKARWFTGGDQWKETIRDFDFRVGGREQVVGIWSNGTVTDFRCLYHDIVPNQRIIYTYDMYVSEKRISISLATIEIRGDGKGTRLVVTEQGAFLDG